MWSALGVIAIVLVAFVVFVYVIKINDDLRIFDDRLDVLEWEVRYLKEYENDRKQSEFN